MSYNVAFHEPFQHFAYIQLVKAIEWYCLSSSGFLTLGSGLIIADCHEFGVVLDWMEKVNSFVKTGAS